MSEEVRAENCSDFSHVVQSCGRIVHEFYGTIYANKENGKLESNKRMWLYEKIHISILGNRVSVTYSKVVYSLDFEVTPHLLRHTYITNLIHASVDPKTVQYLAGHENSKITMDIYAKAKYNRPDELAGMLEDTFTLWDAE